MSAAMTVLGEVAVDQLGPTLVHEHVLCDLDVYWNPESAPDLIDKTVTPAILGDLHEAPFAAYDNLGIRNLTESLDALRLFAAAGGGTIMDVTSHGLHRQPRALAWLSEASSVNIVAGCGYYIAGSYSPALRARTAEAIAEEIITELTEGIGDTGIRAGVIGEIGVGQWPPHPDELIGLEAVAMAQRETRRPVVVHCPAVPGSIVPLARQLADLGLDPASTVLSHLDVRLRHDLESFDEVAALGFLLGLDTFGRELYYPERRAQHPSDDQRVDLVVALVERGLEEQVFLSHDICLRHELPSNGGIGYHHLLARIVPRLAERGVAAETCERILVDNPARILTGGAV